MEDSDSLSQGVRVPVGLGKNILSLEVGGLTAWLSTLPDGKSLDWLVIFELEFSLWVHVTEFSLWVHVTEFSLWVHVTEFSL
jgi:hypothetical protein